MVEKLNIKQGTETEKYYKTAGLRLMVTEC